MSQQHEGKGGDEKKKNTYNQRTATLASSTEKETATTAKVVDHPEGDEGEEKGDGTHDGLNLEGRQAGSRFLEDDRAVDVVVCEGEAKGETSAADTRRRRRKRRKRTVLTRQLLEHHEDHAVNDTRANLGTEERSPSRRSSLILLGHSNLNVVNHLVDFGRAFG